MGNKNVGRPSKYNEAVAHEICSRLMQGQGLIEICRDCHMPSEVTVFSWLDDKRHKEFLKRYRNARVNQAAYLADEIMEIADDGTNDWIDRANKDGTTYRALDHEHVTRSTLRVNARKWHASKLAPLKYGDKIQNEQSGTITVVFDKQDEGNL